MAVAATINEEQPITLVTAVTLVTGTGRAKSLILWESTTDVYLVTLGSATDGGVLPATGRAKIPAAVMPFEVDIATYGQLGLAGVAAGTVRLEFRG